MAGAPPNTYQAPAVNKAHVSRALGLFSSRDDRSETFPLVLRSLTLFPSSGAEITLHQTLIEAQPFSPGALIHEGGSRAEGREAACPFAS